MSILPVGFRCWPRWKSLTVAALLCASAFAVGAETVRYHSFQDLSSSLRELVASKPEIARLLEIGKTREGRQIWAVEIANRNGTPLDSRPGILVAANFEADQLCGAELALAAVDYLLKNYPSNADVKQRVDDFVFYILPRLNPDGAEAMFAPVKTGRKTNTTPTDDDNDGRVDEDGPEDLNNDGLITVMRVKDPHGDYMIHPDEPRLLKKANPQRGEAGEYRVYWEGIDNDNDGFINEDPPGGVDLNRNFQHKYPYYAPDAGRHMVSEPESRALVDFMIGHRNIAIILTFGESDNLISASTRRTDAANSSSVDLLSFAARSTAEARTVGMVNLGGTGGFRFRGFGAGGGREDEGPPSRQQQAAGGGRGSGGGGRQLMPARRPAETVNAGDNEYFRTIAEKYRSLTGLRATPAVRPPAGAFFDYGYFQFGVPSFSTPGWGLPAPSRESRPQPAPEGRPQGEDRPTAGAAGRSPAAFQGAGRSQATAAAAGLAGEESRADEGTAAFDVRLLHWMDAEKIEGFVPWTPFKHPTLGDVEIGGFKPYASTTPPAAVLAELGRTHSEFIVYLASLLSRVSVAETTVTSLGGNLFRIKAEVTNTGYLPTSLAHGVVSRSVRPVMVQLGVDTKDIVSGSDKTSFIRALAGSGRRQKYEWVIKGTPGSVVSLKVVSQKSGADTRNLTLK